jgi:hypothetical protein
MALKTKMQSKIRALVQGWPVAIAWTLLVILTGCGGGGSSSQADADLQYSGSTTPAVIDAANADQLAGEALEAGSTGSSLGMVDGARVNARAVETKLRSINLPLNLTHVAEVNDPTSLPMFINGVLVRHTGTLSDTCGFGGYVDYDKSYEDTTGAFKATYWFYDYCDKGSLINGMMSSSGFVDPATEELLTCTQRFRKLTDGSATVSGSININATGSPIAIVFNALIRDDTTGKIYWIKDYTLLVVAHPDLNPDLSYITVDVSGTFYNPDHGFVRLTTDSLLEIAEADEHPRVGAIIIEGINSAGDLVKVKLTALDSDYCKIEADLDNDGDYDDFIVPSIGWDDL